MCFRKIAVVIMMVGLLFIMTSCNQYENTVESKNVLEVSIYSGWSGSYDFVLKEDKTFIVTYVRNNNSAQATLSDKDYNHIIELWENLGEFKGHKAMVLDCWAAGFEYNGKDIYFTYGCSKNENYDLLITELIKLSPLEDTKTITPVEK